MDQVTSRFNGIVMDRHPGISNANWQATKQQLTNTEGSRLFGVGKSVPAQAEVVQKPRTVPKTKADGDVVE